MCIRDSGKRSLGQLSQSWSTEDRSSNAGDATQDAVFLSLCGLCSSMTKCDVTNFVGHHSGHLTFVPCSLNHSAIHIHWTTRQSEGVYVTRINNFKVVSEFRMLELTGYSTDQTVA